MGFWSDIADTFKHDDVLTGLNEAQSKALIDVLTLIVYADDEASFLELTELELLLHELPWSLSNANEVDAYTEESVKQAKAYKTPGEIETRATELALILVETPIRKKALKMAATLVYANWDASNEEHEALLILADAFEIPEPFARAMIMDISKEQTGHTDDVPTADEADTIQEVQSNTIRDVLTNNFLDGFFSDLFEGDDLKMLSEEASMAFVDALTVALVADGYPEDEELQEFKSQIEQLPFSNEDRDFVQARVEITINTMRRFDPQGQLDYIRGIGDRIPSDKLKSRALRMAIAVTHADFAITRNEHAILNMIARGFGIDAERTKAMIQEVKNQQADGFIS